MKTLEIIGTILVIVLLAAIPVGAVMSIKAYFYGGYHNAFMCPRDMWPSQCKQVFPEYFTEEKDK